jgi:putative transposase
VVQFLSKWYGKTELKMKTLLHWIGISAGKLSDWQKRYQQANKHNCMVVRGNWLTAEERSSIIRYYRLHPDEGYRRLTFMMLDENVVAVVDFHIILTIFITLFQINRNI